MNNYHIPVMPKEVLEYLDIKKGSWYIDCNLGGGGHTELILEKGGKVLGIDLDSEAINEVKSKYNLQGQYCDNHEFFVSSSLIITQANFSEIEEIVNIFYKCHPEFISGSSNRLANNQSGKMPKQVRHDIKIMGILFDLGVSTHQLEQAQRGFSFNLDAPLDMRMNQIMGASAKDLVNGLYEKELAELFSKLGEENFSRPIAKKIVEYRNKKPIETTNELANIILSVRRRTPTDRTHPATRVFQALRIAVNDELNSLKEALPKAFELLAPGGRLVVISFHSLEDRIVKNYFKSICHPEQHPSSHSEEHVDEESKPRAKLLSKDLVETSKEETLKNPRARSGKLRAIEKLV